jgi:hypothetical protein
VVWSGEEDDVSCEIIGVRAREMATRRMVRKMRNEAV